MTSALAMTRPALADTFARPIDIRAGPLSDALQSLARQTGAELLFDHDAVARLSVPMLKARLTPEAAARRLTASANLTVRSAASGALIVERPAAPALAQQDAVVPELLVIGRRTQNIDIRRLENDIQPYRVVTGLQVTDANRDNLGQFFGSRVPANTEFLPPSLDVKGETASEINLRGLGPGSTLVLIDGRRMPGVPALAPTFGFRQPDLNAVPLYAIERVETLTGAAGGIHGMGALGGVVNVVLGRDQRGVELHATGGVSARGDARTLSLEAGGGFTPDGGATEAMFYVAASQAEPLHLGQRGYSSEDMRAFAQLAPAVFVSLSPTGDGVTLIGPRGANLVLKPAYGGTSLGSDHAFLARGFSGNTSDLTAALTQGAGKLGLDLTDGQAASDLDSTPRTAAALANVRHRFDTGFEVYLDAIMLWDGGEYTSHKTSGVFTLLNTSPASPFQQDVALTFPIPGIDLRTKTRFDSARYTGGVVTPLPRGWRATTEVAFGYARYESRTSQLGYLQPTFIQLGQPNAPTANPLGNWDDFQNALLAYLTPSSGSVRMINHYADQSLRLAGPVFRTAAGETMLTLLAERETQHIPSFTTIAFTGANPLAAPSNPAATPQTTAVTDAFQATGTTSFSAQLQPRIFGEAAPAPFLRGLELQLAFRHDSQTIDFSTDPTSPDPGKRLTRTFVAAVYTAGAKVSPFHWLTLRGSYATGQAPPSIPSLIQSVNPTTFISLANDSKRGNRPIGIDMPYVDKRSGSPDLTAIRASTASLGAIIQPLGRTGPSLSVDYSWISKTDDVAVLNDVVVVAHEDYWPDRVTRGPLTDADRAKGYTAGPITMIDARASNGGSQYVNTVDAHLDWSRPFLSGGVRLYGDATYYPRNVQKTPFQIDVENVGYLGGPLKWRANSGVEWSAGSVRLGANLQYFGSYRISPTMQPNDFGYAASVARSTSIQGASRVPSQAYLDLHAAARHRFRAIGADRDVRFELGVANVLDKTPPREASMSTQAGAGYSRFGDPRRRRVQMTISCPL